MSEKGEPRVELFRQPIVLQRIEAACPEPYRTLLLVHAYLQTRGLSREQLAEARLDDVATDADGQVTILGAPIAPYGVQVLRDYLRTWLVRRDSPYLFPMPRDGDDHAKSPMAKRFLIRAGRGLPIGGERLHAAARRGRP